MKVSMIAETIGRPDIDHVSKRELFTLISKLHGMVRYLSFELYCENKSHVFYDDLQEREKELYEIYLMRRREKGRMK